MRSLDASHGKLEPLVEAHATELFAALSDPAIYEYEGEPPPSLERLQDGLRRRESRLSRDGTQTILDWAVRLPSGELAGYVQATLYSSGAAYIAYEFSSAFWGRGIGTSAVRSMLGELKSAYAVHTFVAVLKQANFRSLGLLRKLGFTEGTADDATTYEAGADEVVLTRPSTSSAAEPRPAA